MKKIIAMLLCLVMMLGLAACAGSSENAGSTTTNSTASSETSTTGDSTDASAPSDTSANTGETADASDLSNTLIYAGEGTDTINPILDTHGELVTIVFDGLLKLDGNGKPVPSLAETYAYDEDTLTYTFNLRKDVKWHDGEDFNAEDVLFTYDILMHDETIAASTRTNYEDITSIEAPDDYTVVITLGQPVAAMETYFVCGIMPKHLLEGEDISTTSFNQAPVGTGKYKLESWDMTGGMITFVRNEDYFGKVPSIERLIYKTVGDETTKATMLQSGEADLAWLNANYAAQFRGNDAYKNWDFTTADYRACSMDFRTEFWQQNGDSIGVLNYALDKELIVESILQGQGAVAYSPIQLNPLGTNKDADIYTYDLEKFDAEMTKLGWVKGDDGIYERNGQDFHFTIQVREYEEERVDIANLVSNMLKMAGVDMEVVFVTKFDWTSGYNGFLAGYATEFDPDMIYAQFVTGGSNNTMQYSNAEVDELLKKARHTVDPAERLAIYGEFEKVYAEHPGVLLVAYLDGNYVGISGIDGLDTTRVLGHHAVGVMWNIEDWTITR